MHIFEDLKPYICTFAGCKDELAQFPNRAGWAEHEFSQHRVTLSWSCPNCPQNFTNIPAWHSHVEEAHGHRFSGRQFEIAKEMAYKIEATRIEEAECPLCRIVVGKPRRGFVKHVARHMEETALMALPRNIEEDSDEDSVTSDYPSLEESRENPQAEIEVRRSLSSASPQPAAEEHIRTKAPPQRRPNRSLSRISTTVITEEDSDPAESSEAIVEQHQPRGSLIASRVAAGSNRLRSITSDLAEFDPPGYSMGRVDAMGPPSDEYPIPPPPKWLTSALVPLEQKYPDDRFEAIMRYTAVDIITDLPVTIRPDETPPENIKFMYYPRIKCEDCPGELYTPGPGTGTDNFEIHLMNKLHRAKVESWGRSRGAVPCQGSGATRG